MAPLTNQVNLFIEYAKNRNTFEPQAPTLKNLVLKIYNEAFTYFFSIYLEKIPKLIIVQAFNVNIAIGSYS